MDLHLGIIHHIISYIIYSRKAINRLQRLANVHAWLNVVGQVSLLLVRHATPIVRRLFFILGLLSFNVSAPLCRLVQTSNIDRKCHFFLVRKAFYSLGPTKFLTLIFCLDEQLFLLNLRYGRLILSFCHMFKIVSTHLHTYRVLDRARYMRSSFHVRILCMCPLCCSMP